MNCLIILTYELLYGKCIEGSAARHSALPVRFPTYPTLQIGILLKVLTNLRISSIKYLSLCWVSAFRSVKIARLLYLDVSFDEWNFSLPEVKFGWDVNTVIKIHRGEDR